MAGDDEGHKQILREAHRVLKPGSLFVLTAINALSAARNDVNMDAYTNTTSAIEMITNAAGASKEVDIYTTAFTFRELKLLFEESEFSVLDGYGCSAGSFGDKRLSVSDIEIMIVAQRV